MQSEFFPFLPLLAFLSAPLQLILVLGTPLCDLKLLKITFCFQVGPSLFLGHLTAYASVRASQLRSLPLSSGSGSLHHPTWLAVRAVLQTLQPRPGGCFRLANSTHKATGLFWAVPTSVQAFSPSPPSPLVRLSEEFHICWGASPLMWPS